jgi:hypothetical protein
VFERGRNDAATGPTADVTVEVASAYDQDLPTSALRQLTSSSFQSNGMYTTLAPQLDFKAGGGRIKLGLSTSSNVRHYPDLHQVFVMDHFVGGGLTAQVTPQTMMAINQTVMYAPTYLNGLFSATAGPVGGIPAPPDASSTVNEQRSYAYATTAGLAHNVSPRGVVSVDASVRNTNFVGQDASYPNFRSYDSSVRFAYSLSRNVRLQLGYRFALGQTVGFARTTENDLSVGLAYDLVRSQTRKTTIAFSLGPSQATGAVPTEASLEIKRQYGVFGDASIVHNMGRTWNARANYHRGLGFIEGLPRPAYSSAYAGSVDGFLSRRLDLSLSAGYSTGESALIGLPAPFSSYTGSSRLRIALGREWATYVQYVYYYYNFSEGLLLPAGVSHGLSRGGVRVGLTLWLPLRRG